ncbi:AbrB/MazE/SpoVT family DNA-binding domain-containing protein [Devosia sp.]|uniref:AbrB/MazE/SpoVT family DNA-binding domain-containing protein n=1 Tax=Devosia sp. TaxID=1871048 RepID=UPI00326547F4
MQSTLKKFGNSSGVIIPKPLLSELGVQAGDQLNISVIDGRLVIEQVAKKHPREGWAEAAKLIAEAGDDEFVWEDFVEDADDEWVW